MITKVFYCEDRPEAILTAIYDAWADSTPNREIRINLRSEAVQVSFVEIQIPVESSYEKAEKVLLSVSKRLGFRVHRLIEGALCAAENDKADAIFRFLQYAFSAGHDVSGEYGTPVVMRLFELDRKARRESHLMLGFTRFSILPGNIAFAKIGPVNDVLPLLADHFAERFNTQPFLIYDEKRHRSVVYTPGEKWYFLEGELDLSSQLPALADEYERLWKRYFDSVAIRERFNPVCQRTLCPLHFREYMIEFK